MTHKEKIDWCIYQHGKTNHKYGDNEPYSTHLHEVNRIAKSFFYLIPNADTEQAEIIQLACYGHDLIEDTRNTYNDIKNVLGETVAEIVYALTNEKGRNRAERANVRYYHGVTSNQFATFVKLCDRIANVRYSKNNKSSMFNAYKKENEKFMNLMCYNETHIFIDMFDYLNELFKN